MIDSRGFFITKISSLNWKGKQIRKAGLFVQSNRLYTIRQRPNEPVAIKPC